MNRGNLSSAHVSLDVADDLTVAVERLASVLIDENTAMRGMDFARAGALLKVKYAAADALETAIRSANDMSETLHGSIDCLAPLMAENQKLHHRAARLQRRVNTLVGRLTARAAAATRRRGPVSPMQVVVAH